MHLARIMILIFVLIVVTPVTESATHSLTAKTFYIYGEKKMHWNDAWATCDEAGLRLAMIHNYASLEALIAYSRNSYDVWKIRVKDAFWIGLHKEPTSSSVFRWDRCEELNFINWQAGGHPQNPETAHCVAAQKDDYLAWKSDACGNEHQFMCEEDKGQCNYTRLEGYCDDNHYNGIDIFTSTEESDCEERCSTEIQNDKVCWMYSYHITRKQCILYFDTTPLTCIQDEPSRYVMTGIRSCFTFEFRSSDDLTSTLKSDSPSVECEVNTTDKLSSKSTTSFTIPTSPTASPLDTLDTFTTLTTRPLSTAAVPTPAINTTTSAAPTITTTTTTITILSTIAALKTASKPTTLATTITATTTTATTTKPSSSASTKTTSEPTDLNTDTKTPATEVTTFLLSAATPPSAMNTSTTAASPNPVKTHTEAPTARVTAFVSASPTTSELVSPSTSVSVTTQIYTTTVSAVAVTVTQSKAALITTHIFCDYTLSTDASIAPVQDTCPCNKYSFVKNQTDVKRMMDYLHLWNTVDKSTLSATRRRLESATDDRPSAQALGFAGILFISVWFSLFVLVDLMRLCKHCERQKNLKTRPCKRV